MRLRLAILLFAACAGHADVSTCVCELTSPTIQETRGCSLCLEAEKHPDEKIFLVRDNDPAKPNRWLAIPRAKFDGANPLAQMNADDRLALWTTAIAKAKELWGDGWGVSMNSDIARRQCHAHVHIGKLLPETDRVERETDASFYVDGPAQLPAIADGSGLWFHPVSGAQRLHVHTGGDNTERVLMR